MNSNDWQCIADAIREKRFEDITQELWNQVADKIEPKKRGRRSKPKFEKSSSWNESEPLKQFNEWFEWKQTTKATDAMDYHCEIKERYYALIEQGIPSVEATKLVAEAMALGYKNVERVLTAIRLNDKINREIEEWERKKASPVPPVPK